MLNRLAEGRGPSTGKIGHNTARVKGMVRSIISGTAKVTTIKTWRAQYLDADNSVNAKKKKKKIVGACVEPDFL